MTTVDRNIVNKIVNTIDGWFFENEAYSLAEYASKVNNCIVEIGAYRGRTTVLLASFAPYQTPIYSIDPHIISPGEESLDFGDHDRLQWTKNVYEWGVAATVKPINLKSSDVWPIWSEKIDLLFIDGAHDYNSVKADLMWCDFVTKTGIIVVHDNNRDQIQKALSERHDIELVKVTDLTNFYKIKA